MHRHHGLRLDAAGSLVWGLNSAGCRGALAVAVAERVAAQELGRDRLTDYSTKEVCSLLHAYGGLAPPGRSAQVAEYAAALAAELVRRMQVRVAWRGRAGAGAGGAQLLQPRLLQGGQRVGVPRICWHQWEAWCRAAACRHTPSRLQDAPYVRSELSASDCAQLAAACASVFDSGSGTPQAVGALLDELAHEVRRQLANKHSLRSPFSARELVQLVGAYAALGHRSAKVSGGGGVGRGGARGWAGQGLRFLLLGASLLEL